MNSFALEKYIKLEKSLESLREADELLCEEMAELWYDLSESERKQCDASAFAWGKGFLTDSIYNLVRLSLFHNMETLKNNPGADFRDFRTVTINLSRRKGHSTVAIRLLRDLPSSYLFTNSHSEHRRMTQLVEEVMNKRPTFSLDLCQVINVNLSPEPLKGTKAKFLIFDNASCTDRRIIEDIVSSQPEAFVILLG